MLAPTGSFAHPTELSRALMKHGWLTFGSVSCTNSQVWLCADALNTLHGEGGTAHASLTDIGLQRSAHLGVTRGLLLSINQIHSERRRENRVAILNQPNSWRPLAYYLDSFPPSQSNHDAGPSNQP